MEFSRDLFNAYNYRIIRENVYNNPPPVRDVIMWDSMNDCTQYFSKKKSIKSIDVVLAMGIAYSWMPTMLRIYDVNDLNEFDTLIADIGFLKKIQTYKELCRTESEVINAVTRLKSIINHSVVGTSKVLYLFSSQCIPIIDNRVITAWNCFFGNYPNYMITNTPESYVAYWKALLYWKGGISGCSVRKIEKAFFDYGGYILRNQKKVIEN